MGGRHEEEMEGFGRGEGRGEARRYIRERGGGRPRHVPEYQREPEERLTSGVLAVSSFPWEARRLKFDGEIPVVAAHCVNARDLSKVTYLSVGDFTFLRKVSAFADACTSTFAVL